MFTSKINALSYYLVGLNWTVYKNIQAAFLSVFPVPHQTGHKKQTQQQQEGSSSHPLPAPPSILLSDTTITPWEGLAHAESSFTTISPALPPPRPPPLPPSPPAVPQPTPVSPHGKQDDDEESSSFSSERPSPFPVVCQKNPGKTNHVT